MPDQDGEVGIGRLPPHRRQIFGKGFELPVDPGAQRADVHAFDDREVAHDQVAQRGRRGDDPETAIAGDDGGDAERG